MRMVLARASGTWEKDFSISSADLKYSSSVLNFMRSGSSMVVCVWMQSSTSWASASSLLR